MKTKQSKYSLLLTNIDLTKIEDSTLDQWVNKSNGLEYYDISSLSNPDIDQFDFVLIGRIFENDSISVIKNIYNKKDQIKANSKGIRISNSQNCYLLKSNVFKKMLASVIESEDIKSAAIAHLKALEFYLLPIKMAKHKQEVEFLSNLKTEFKNSFDNISYYISKGLLNPKDSFKFWGGWFFILSILTFFIIVYCGFHAGISGDEFRYEGQSEKVYEYFKTYGNDKRAITSSGIDPQHYNAQSFDVAVYSFSRWLGIDDSFTFRHFFNSLIGWLGMFVAGILAAKLFGWQAGFLTLFLLFISPRYFGHSLNNHRDIPVATAYIFSIYFLIKYLLHFPRPSKKTLTFLLLSIAAAFSVRFASGVLTIGIIGVCCFVQLVFQYFDQRKFSEVIQSVKKHTVYLSVVFLGSILLGNILWPFFWESPLKNSLEVFKASSNLGVSLRQIFEGEHIWSNTIPWYYIPKYILITTPIIVLFGFLLHLLFPHKVWKKGLRLPVFILVFATLFPLIYAMLNVKNDYGGWRHFLFIYPTFAILSSLGLLLAKDFLPQKLRSYFPILILLCSVLPIRHLIVNSPFQYLYYNQIVGGINGAHGYYETDYSFHSMQDGADWIIKNVTPVTNQKIKVIANDGAQIAWGFRKDTANFQTQYTRYYDKYDKDWDYGVYTNSYISAHQLREGIWPPAGTVHSIKVDDVVVTAIVKRSDKRDMQANSLFSQGDYQQGIPLIEAFITDNPNNEQALMALSNAYYNIGNYPKTIEIADRAIQVYPEAIGSFVTKGLSLLNTNQIDMAESTFRQGIEANSNYYPMYYYLALVLQRKNQPNEALRNAEMALRFDPKYRPAVELIITVYDSQNMKTEADKYRAYLNGL